MKEYIEREALMKRMKEAHCAECNDYNGVRCRACWVDDALDWVDSEPAANVVERKHGEWVSVEERLPEVGSSVLAVDCFGGIAVVYVSEKPYVRRNVFSGVRYWAPIPESPVPVLDLFP